MPSDKRDCVEDEEHKLTPQQIYQQRKQKKKFKEDSKAAKGVRDNLHPNTKKMRRGYNPMKLYLLMKPLDSSDKEIKKNHPTEANYEAAEHTILENFNLIKAGMLVQQ
ncbi:hypothetical protein PtB15_15B142 [Puccinia triticina]|nr:hypothetical protein PtB15_15B142 [Puccinia triticina]